LRGAQPLNNEAISRVFVSSKRLLRHQASSNDGGGREIAPQESFKN